MCTADVYRQNVENNTWPEVHFMVFKTSLAKVGTSTKGSRCHRVSGRSEGLGIVLDVLLKTPVTEISRCSGRVSVSTK